jgi:class 3 adenylate cyclase
MRAQLRDEVRPMTRTHNSRVPQAVRTHVFIDMKGYGRLLAERPNAETAKTMRTYFRVVRAQLPRKAVEVDQIADTFHLAFADALEAVRTADRVAAALALKDIHAGIGLDAGQSLRAKGRYVGIAVANASALSSRAGPGQILITQNVLALVRNELDYAPRDLGLLAYAEGRVRMFEVRGRDESARDRYRVPDRTLVALLFFDMVGSTAKSAALGAASSSTPRRRGGHVWRWLLRDLRSALERARVRDGDPRRSLVRARHRHPRRRPHGRVRDRRRQGRWHRRRYRIARDESRRCG